MPNDLKEYFADLEKTHGKSSPIALAFKEAIGRVMRGRYDDDEYCKKLRKDIHIQEINKKYRLASWCKVLDEHGYNVSVAALKQGTLPYIPHTLLRPGHGVKWPESHQFLIEQKWWTETWRTEVSVASSSDSAETRAEIAEFLKYAGKWMSDVLADAEYGIPQGESL